MPKVRIYFISDDLTILEIINLLTIGLSSFNIRHQVPNDIGEDNQYIPPENLQSQKYIDEINSWTIKQNMKIIENKTKTMIFNFTNNYQFSTRLKLNDTILQTIEETKLLGTGWLFFLAPPLI